MTARKLSGFLDEPTSGLGPLAREARRLLALNRVWEAIAPPGLARSSRVGLVKDGVLTLYADNGAAAARLKAQLPRLLSNFRQRGYDLNGIRVEVQVKTMSWEPAARPAPPAIPPAALRELGELERRLAPSPLKRALTNLLRRQGLEPDSAQQEAGRGEQGQHDDQ